MHVSEMRLSGICGGTREKEKKYSAGGLKKYNSCLKFTFSINLKTKLLFLKFHFFVAGIALHFLIYTLSSTIVTLLLFTYVFGASFLLVFKLHHKCEFGSFINSSCYHPWHDILNNHTKFSQNRGEYA